MATDVHLVRALEIATDFVDAAGETHPIVRTMIADNDACTSRITGSMTASADWRASAQSLVAAVQDVDAPDHLRRLVTSMLALSDDLGMHWQPSPALMRAARPDR